MTTANDLPSLRIEVGPRPHSAAMWKHFLNPPTTSFEASRRIS